MIEPTGDGRLFVSGETACGGCVHALSPFGGAGAQGTAARGERVTGMYLDGEAIDPWASYSVVANSFLASGGDNFSTFKEGANPQDTGYADLQAMVDYMAEFADETPLPVDYAQDSVGATFPEGAAASYGPGDRLEMTLSSLVLAPLSGVTMVQDD